MNYKEYIFTASEITQLEHMLSTMPDDMRVERIGLEYRLRKARERLEGVPVPPKPKSVYASFQGEPVLDGVGMDANFAGKATTALSESTAITTAGVTGELQDTGAIPRRDLGRLVLSGVTRGSFRLEIELPPPTADGRHRGQIDNPAEEAVELIQTLLESSLTGTDEELASLTDQMHPRAVRKVAEFLEILRTHRAQVAIGFNGREVALRDRGEVQKAVDRLSEQNIRDETSTLDGTLIGIVPAKRFFEFGTLSISGSIEGRIGQEINDPYRVAARYANQRIRAKIRRIQVGEGQPKFTLLEILELVDEFPPCRVKPLQQGEKVSVRVMVGRLANSGTAPSNTTWGAPRATPRRKPEDLPEQGNRL